MSETTAISMSERLVLVAPGLFLCSVVAAAARFLSEHYGAPQMLFALLLGMALHFLMDDPRSATGIDFAARSVLRLGVALLGVRITFDQVGHLGGSAVLWMAGGVALTIGFGALAVRLTGQSTRFGILSGGAVAICGASAAMAIAAVLPRDARSERDTILVVVTVTALSTLAMIVYPMITAGLRVRLPCSQAAGSLVPRHNTCRAGTCRTCQSGHGHPYHQADAPSRNRSRWRT